MKKIGKYEILGTLGKGGMGIVYKALDPDIEREVAIKTIRFDTLTEGQETEELLTRVIREAKAAGRLNHPNIITIYDVVRDKDLTYIVMQYIDGQSLQALIDSGKPFSPLEIINTLKPVSEALDFAHQNGIVHRDIKPANILIDRSGQPFLADFGVARIETSTLTQAGTTVGTLSYMSPEQVKGQTVDKRSDIFALGVILYELLTGKKPFGGDNMSTIVYRIVNEEPPRVTDINKELHGGYESVVRKALAKDPEARYQSCREMIADLENPSRLAEATRVYAFSREADREPRKSRKALVWAGGVFLVIVGVGAYVLLPGRPGKSSGPPGKPDAAKKEVVVPSPTPAQPVDDRLPGLKESFDQKAYSETVRLAEEILAGDPANAQAREFLGKARAEIVASEAAPFLQAGISSYAAGKYAQCVSDMEKVLKIDKDNRDAKKYILQAETALAKPEISALIERLRVAEEEKDLVTILSLFDSAALADAQQSEYRLLFNGYDGIKSIISKISITFAGRAAGTAQFSQLLTAVYKKTGQRKIVFEGQKTWPIRKHGDSWKISAVQ
jgi:serine/threonine-protein kinase